jgi:hypothetical protein
MLDKITAALQQLTTLGSFSAKQTSSAKDLHIEINPVGRLKFPLKPAIVKKLIKEARPAKFGWRDKTCLDTEVRDVWKISKSRVKLDKRTWNKTLNPTIDKLKGELGLPEQSRLRAELHDVLIYGPGQFFLPHQDSEKCDGMVATLVVVLPSPHSGGTLIVDHQGEKKSYQSSRAAGDKLTFIAFYADCHHEVRPIKEGYRVALTYNLILEGNSEKPMAAISTADAQQALIEALRNYFLTPSTDDDHVLPKQLVYLLDHEYTPKGVSWKTLKNGDRLRAASLLAAADALDLEIHLALADVQEIWDCEVEEPSWGFGSRRRYWDHYDDDYDDDDMADDEGQVELRDLIDDSITLKHWRNAVGKAVDLPEWYAGGAEVCWTKASDELNPFQSEYEGWMGNEGNTMERCYHRAAIILWRQEDHYSSLLKIAPDMALSELLPLAEKKATRPQAQAIVRDLLPNLSDLRRFDTKPSGFNRIFKLALRLEDNELAKGLLLPLGIDALCHETARALIRLQTAYGTRWLIDIIRAWFDSPTYRPWGRMINKLSPLIQRWVEQAPESYRELTHWLLAHQLGAVIENHLQQARDNDPITHLEYASDRIDEMIDLLSASLTSLDNEIFNQSIDHLIMNESSYLVFDLVEIARYLKRQKQQVDATEPQRARFLKFVRGRLTALLDRPPRRSDDWSIVQEDRCGCADCQELNKFLQSSRLDHKVWPMAKGRRLHIHREIDAMGIPVTHDTERTGSPHKLHLRKTEQLFRQDQARRFRLKDALDDLAEQ